MTAQERADMWYPKFSVWAGDLYPGVYTEEQVKKLATEYEEILALKREKRSTIVAHYYLTPEFHETADHVGDSLALALAVVNEPGERVDFESVFFMPATAKAYLGDRKRIYVSDYPEVLGCSLVASIDPVVFERWRSNNPYPKGVIVTYINSDPYTKSLSDYICTSRNAEKILRHVIGQYPGSKILFAPDKFLGTAILQHQMGAELNVVGESPSLVHLDAVLDGKTAAIDLYQGACHVHQLIGELAMEEAMRRYPDAEALIHPECGCSSSCLVWALDGKKRAQFFSTQQMIEHAQKSPSKRFIVATERGHVYALRSRVPGKEFFPASYAAYCQYMKGNTFEKLLRSLKEDRIEIVLCNDCCDPKNPYRDEKVIHLQRSVAAGARRAIERMLTIV